MSEVKTRNVDSPEFKAKVGSGSLADMAAQLKLSHDLAKRF